MISAYIACAGGLGAVSRYMISIWLSRFSWRTSIPYPILIINLIGAFLLGVAHSFFQSDVENVGVILTMGFLGAFTTFSTFSVESIELYMKKKWSLLVVYVSGSVIGSIIFYLIGFHIY